MKNAIVTGASTGLGLLFAQTLKEQGWEVTGVARSEDKLKAYFAEGNYVAADCCPCRVLRSILPPNLL